MGVFLLLFRLLAGAWRYLQKLNIEEVHALFFCKIQCLSIMIQNKINDEKRLVEFREYLWKYFSMHADQRLKTFNFYLLISALLFGAYGTLFKNASGSIIICFFPSLITFTSFVFWKLDQRTKSMIKYSENALKLIDKELCQDFIGIISPDMLNIFKYEDNQTEKNNKDTYCFLCKTYSYTNCFNLIFLVFGGIGLLITIFHLTSLFHSIIYIIIK